MNLLIFGELIASNNFYILLSHTSSLFSPYLGLGSYLQGLPISNTLDFFWGTNAGIRSLPILIFLTFLQNVFGTYSQGVYFLLSFIFPFITFFLACRLLKKPTLFTIIGTVFYGGNLWITTRLYTGFWQLNLVYAFLPFLITIPLRIAQLKKPTFKELMLYGSSYAFFASLVLIAQPHFLIITSLFSLFFFVVILLRRDMVMFLNLCKMYLIAGIIFFFLNAYFLLPSIISPELSFTAPNQYFSLASVAFNGQGNFLEHVLRFDPLGFSQKVFVWRKIHYLQLFPLLFFFILFIMQKKKNYLYFSLVILFLFLAKGLNPPFTSISYWLYDHIFILHYFRDPARFLSGVALFASLNIAAFTPEVKLNRKISALIAMCMLMLFVVINRDNLIGPKTKVFEATHIPSSYISMQKYINSTLGINSGRILILPNAHGLIGYPWYHNPSPNTSNIIFDNILPLTIPLADSTNYPDTYANQISAFLYMKFTQSYDSNYLRPLGVTYILLDSSITRPESEKDIATRSADLLKAKHYQLVHKEGSLSLFHVPSASSLYSFQKPLFAIGDFNTIAKMYTAGNTPPIILLNQLNFLRKNQDEALKGKTIFTDTKDPILTITSERLASKYFVDILSAGWNYDQIFGNYEPYKMQNITESGALFTSGRAVISSPSITKPMTIPYSLTPGTYRILLKSLTKEPTVLQVTINDKKKTIAIDTKNILLWQNGGVVTITKSAKNIILKKDDINPLIIDYLLLVPESAYQKESSYLFKVIKTMQPLSSNLHQNPIRNSVISASPSRIQLEKPTRYFAYNVSYGKYWKSNVDSNIFFSNGYGMAFMSKDEAIRSISYWPNYLYLVSLLISGISWLLTLGYIMKEVLRSTRNRGKKT